MRPHSFNEFIMDGVREDLQEQAKFLSLGVCTAVTYGVCHDLVTTQIYLPHFSDLRLTHHG